MEPKEYNLGIYRFLLINNKAYLYKGNTYILEVAKMGNQPFTIQEFFQQLFNNRWFQRRADGKRYLKDF